MLPHLGLRLPELLQFIRAAVDMKRLPFLSHTTATGPSKDNEKSACSFAGRQLTPGEFLMFLLAIFKKLSASILNNSESKNLNNSLYSNNKGNSGLDLCATYSCFKVVLYKGPPVFFARSL